MAPRVYLDWNATAPLRPEARAAMVAAMDLVGNPSSVHSEGRAARAAVERARAQVAALIDCAPDEVIFTSGATEAAGVLSSPVFGEVRVDPTAHDCLQVHARRGRDGLSVLAWGFADNETGVIAEAPPRAADELLLIDATQAAGRIPFSFRRSGADLAILSAHKMGGPKGAGALILRAGLDLPPLQEGGGQESRRRAGTENLAGIAGFGAAAAAARAERETGAWDRVAQIRNILERRLSEAVPDVICIGREGPRLPNTACLAVPGWKGETQVMQMDLAGFAVSAGSACSSGKVGPSRTLRAMGFDADVARSAIRVSLGPLTTAAEVEAFADAWIERHRRFAARRLADRRVPEGA